MFIPKRQTKRQRLAAILAEIDTSEIRELPPEADAIDAAAPVVADTTDIGVPKEIDIRVISEDGRLLVGRDWTLPEHYIEDDVQHGRLVALKGCTPLGWPSLDDPPEGAGPSGDANRGGGPANLPK